jgi:hypothetical protein
MKLNKRQAATAFVVIAALLPCGASGEQAATITKITVPLTVPAGTPLRLYITRRAWFRPGQQVTAKTIEPVWAFDRVVIPAGTVLNGSIAKLKSVGKVERAMAIMHGDFTPLKRAEVTFTALQSSQVKPLAVQTEPALGLAAMYVPPRPRAKPAPTKPAKVKAQSKNKAAKVNPDPNSKTARLRAFVKQQAQTQANARSGGFLGFVRGQNKREWLENYLWSRLPYHPQFYGSGTRFDATLARPLEFGTSEIPVAEVERISTATVPEGQAMVRFLSNVTSADAKPGEPVRGVLSQPLYSQSHQLVLPEGTRLTGKVTLARPAKLFHRGGQLRFAFNRVEMPEWMAGAGGAPAVERSQTQVIAAESRNGVVVVDGEGTVKSTESKTRFLKPVVAGLVAAKSLDNDEGKVNGSPTSNANYSGRSLGGFSGFGLLGTAVTLGPKNLGAALGFYGLAMSTYSNIVARGREVSFQKNDAVNIRFAPAPVRR